jgi:hypothetical protein
MPTANSNTDTSQFGDLVKGLQQLQSLFGSQSREQSQQFSTKQVDDQVIAANTASTQAGLSSLNQQQQAASFGAGLNQDAYQNKANTDYNQASKLKNLNMGGGSSASSFGKGAFQPGGYSTNAYGQTGLYNASAVADWGLQQASAIKSVADYSKAEAEGDIARAQGQVGAQQHLLAAQTNADMAKMQQEQSFQKGESAADRASRERTAAAQSQASILSSLFGSVSSGSPNYRYWN